MYVSVLFFANKLVNKLPGGIFEDLWDHAKGHKSAHAILLAKILQVAACSFNLLFQAGCTLLLLLLLQTILEFFLCKGSPSDVLRKKKERKMSQGNIH